MADVKPPRQFTLDIALFPKEPWAKALVEAFNQSSVQTVRALEAAGTEYKLLTFTTGATVADSFPIDIRVTSQPRDVRVAQVVSGAVPAGQAVSVSWKPLGSGAVRILNIAGLSTNTNYAINLALE